MSEMPQNENSRPPSLSLRRFFPSKSILILFWSYTVSLVLILFILFNVNFFSKVDVDPISILQILNVAILSALGGLLFLIIKIFFDVKFTRFISRIDRELKEMLEHGEHPIKFRDSALAPWYIPKLNELTSFLFSRVRSLDSAMEEVEAWVDETERSGTSDPSKVKSIRNNIRKTISDIHERKDEV